MSVGLKKKGSTILADTSPEQNSKKYNMRVFGIRGNPRSSRRAGVIIITMKSGGHRRGLLISTKH